MAIMFGRKVIHSKKNRARNMEKFWDNLRRWPPDHPQQQVSRSVAPHLRSSRRKEQKQVVRQFEGGQRWEWPVDFVSPYSLQELTEIEGNKIKKKCTEWLFPLSQFVEHIALL